MTVSDDNEYLEINLDDLRIRELEELEELTGKPFDGLFVDGEPRGKVLRALGFVVKRRTDPNFTWEAAGELKIQTKGQANPDPTAEGD